MINAAYGACASPYFRFFDTRIAEGITMSGQLAIRWVSQDLNAFMNKSCGTTGFDFVVANDTDSSYLNMAPLVDKFFPNKAIDETVAWLDRFCDGVMQKVINKSYSNLKDYMNAYDQKLIMKREAISSAAVFVAKKRYAMIVHNSEGVQYTDPKIKVTGLEMVRSSTPPAVRETLKGGIKQVLTGTELSVQSYVADFKGAHKSLTLNEIAFPRGVNGLTTYAGSPIYAKGCPIHVRAALLHNHYIKKMGLEGTYELIGEGNKIKFVYLKMPNPFKENVIGFVDKLPKEFGLEPYIDYDLMFDKSFGEAMKTLVEPIGWKIEHQASLEDFFG
ncbi:MAG: family B DNA polymerase [Desulfuromonadaceae bacterium]